MPNPTTSLGIAGRYASGNTAGNSWFHATHLSVEFFEDIRNFNARFSRAELADDEVEDEE